MGVDGHTVMTELNTVTRKDAATTCCTCIGTLVLYRNTKYCLLRSQVKSNGLRIRLPLPAVKEGHSLVCSKLLNLAHVQIFRG
jgi:hypothetical protein